MKLWFKRGGKLREESHWNRLLYLIFRDTILRPEDQQLNIFKRLIYSLQVSIQR